MSSDFFKKLQPLFEDKDEKSVSNLRESATRQENVAKEHKKLDAARKAKKEAARKAADTEQSDREYIAQRQKKEAEKKAEKPANVKETATDFFRKYSDIVTEAEVVTESKVVESYDDDEDPDVAKAMSVKGKDGKKQTDVEKAKKWSFDKKLDKADKSAEDKAAKKVAKDKDLTEAKKSKDSIKAEIKATNDKIDSIVKDGGKVTLTDPLTVKLNKLKKQLTAVNESWDDDDEDPDVAKADAVKGKDGQTQKDADKKLPPWLKKGIEKADKKGEDKGVAKAKKDKDLTESAAPRKVSRHSLEVDGVNQDDPEDGQAFFSYGEYTDGTPLSQEKLAQLTSKYRDIVDIKAFASVKGGDWDHDAWGDDVELEETSPARQWVKNADLNKKPASKIEEGKNKYKHIQQYVKDMDKMSPEQLQQYADYIRREANSMKRWIRDEMSDTYANLKKDEYESGHWSVEMTTEYLEELKKAGERGAIIKPSGGVKPSNNIRSASRGAIGGGFTR